MTTKPKGKKFRIRRGGSLADPSSHAAGAIKKPPSNPGQVSNDGSDLFSPHDDGFGDGKFATSKGPGAQDAKSIAKEIDAIKAEGLSSRQLRMAGRVAVKHGLKPESDLDAVRLLRQKGIDPFKRSTMLELVIADDKGEADNKNLPQDSDQKNLPSTEVMGEDIRAREILIIQQDIARRRRRQTIALFSRLAFFVLLPTVLVGFYYYTIATPLYATKSEFLIQQADSQSGGSLGGLFSGTGFATS